MTVWRQARSRRSPAWVELLADDPAAAERELRWGYDTLGEIGELGWLSTVAGILGEALCAQGRYDEAEELTSVTEESADAEDAYSQALWRSVRAKVLTRRGKQRARTSSPGSPSRWPTPRTSSICAGTCTRRR